MRFASTLSPRSSALLLLGLAPLLLLGPTGCRKGGKGGGTTPGTAATATPPPAASTAASVYLDERVPGEAKQEGDWLVRVLEGDCATLNYVLYTSQYEAEVLNYVLRNVVDLDRELNYVPGLAEKWDVSADGLTYTFHLRADATWEDGKPVTADDFEFTVRSILDPKIPSPNKKPLFEDYASSKVVDPKTYSITFRKPFAGRLGLFNMALIPKHVYGTGDFNAHPANRQPVGNGPYRFVRWVTNQEIELVRRDDYWGEKPAFRKILFKILPDEAVRLNALKTGQIDEARLSSIQWRDMQADASFTAKNRTVLFHSVVMPNFIAWNHRSPLFSDKRVRQALAMLVDRERIAKNIYFGTAEPAAGPFPWGSWARNPNLKPWPFDPPAARKKLEEAGWKDSNGNGTIDRDGKEFAFDLMIPAGNQISEQFGTLLQRELERVGIKMSLRAYEFAIYQGKVSAGEYEAATQALGYDIDPDPTVILHSKQFPPAGFNFFFYANPEVDKLIEAGRLEFDPAKRREIYWRLGEILHDDQPACFVLHPTMKWAVSNRFRGLNLSPLGLYLHHPGSLDWWVPADRQLHK